MGNKGSVYVLGAATAIGDRDEPDPTKLPDALDLIELAVRQVLHPVNVSCENIDWIGVPEGTFVHPDAARAVGTMLGAKAFTSVRADVGVTQDELLANAGTAIATGTASLAVVAGGESRFRQRQLQRIGIEATEQTSATGTEPDVWLRPADLAIDDLELIRDTVTPVVSFALMESAIRHATSRSVAEHDEFLAALQSALCDTASTNPTAWNGSATPVDEIAQAKKIADPYTKPMCSNWTVDLASAVVLVSHEAAERLGVDTSQLVQLRATAWSNHSIPVPARPSLAVSPACSVVIDELFRDMTRNDVPLHVSDRNTDTNLFELYSCFPAAIQQWASAVRTDDGGISLGDLGGATLGQTATQSGGMAAAGGPLNNSAIQGWVALIAGMKSQNGRSIGVSTSVSGSFTKHGGSLWTRGHPPAAFRAMDVSAETKRASGPARPIQADLSGDVSVIAHTVDRRGPRAVAIVESDGVRSIATSDAIAVINRFTNEDLVGRSLRIDRTGRIEAIR